MPSHSVGGPKIPALPDRGTFYARNEPQTTRVVGVNPSQPGSLPERWSLELRAYELSVAYRCGDTNQHADALSRRPVTLVALHPPLEMADIAQALRVDPALSAVFHQLESKVTPPAIVDWLKFPLKRYWQIW